MMITPYECEALLTLRHWLKPVLVISVVRQILRLALRSQTKETQNSLQSTGMTAKPSILSNESGRC